MTERQHERINALLEDIRLATPAQHELLTQLRSMVLSLDTAITEEVKYGGLLYACGQSAFCGLFSYRHHVSLEFGEGAKLTDTYSALEGSGKLRRHIKLVTLKDIADKQVHHYLAEALQASNN